MRLIFAGTPATAVPVLASLAEHHDVRAVLTRPPAARGRSSRLVPSDVEQWARERQIEVLAPESLKDPECVARIREIAPDCCPVVAYGGLITRDLLEIPPHGWVNLHYSLLPAYRGAAPVQRAVLDGRTRTGVTTFRIVPALDAGPIYRQLETDIGPSETAGDLLSRLSLLGARAMVDTLAAISGGEQPREQDADGATQAPKVTSRDARLDMGAPAAEIVNRVRAMSPEPGAWAMLGQERFKILRAALVPDPGADPGTVAGDLTATKKKLFCRARDGWIELIEVQAMGKRAMSGADWARGAWHPGARLD